MPKRLHMYRVIIGGKSQHPLLDHTAKFESDPHFDSLKTDCAFVRGVARSLSTRIHFEYSLFDLDEQ